MTLSLKERTFTGELYLQGQMREKYINSLAYIPSWQLTQRQLCDLELLLNGGFFPLKGFMNYADYNSVVTKMKLMDGSLWPMPITLEVPKGFADTVNIGSTIALRDSEGVAIAVLKINDIYCPHKSEEALSVFGTLDDKHPGVNYLMYHAGEVYIGGDVIGLNNPTYYDFKQFRFTPLELKNLFIKLGWSRIVAFQTRNPMHRAHQELTIRATKEFNAKLLLHPSVGMTKPGDIDHYTRVRCYEKLLSYYPQNSTLLSLLPLAMRMAGPKEALWHAIIRKNYGCTHFIVGRDHAGPGKDSVGKDFYDPYAAQDLSIKYEKEIGINIIPFQEMVYLCSKGKYYPVNQVKDKQDIMSISGTEFRRYLQEGLEIPEWFSFPEVINELRKTHPMKKKQGFTVFFTGLSGAGKSTIANALLVKLMEIGDRPVTLLDGDIVRQNLSSELTFSKEHRDLNVLRMGYVASEVTKHRGIAISALIAPYLETRQKIRNTISSFGGFIEVYVNTSLEICEQRDRKGLYAKARSGLIPHFTGVTDPYEPPINSEIVLFTEETDVESNVNLIIKYIRELGFLC